MIHLITGFEHLILAQTLMDDYGGWACALVESTSTVLPSSPVKLADISSQISQELPFVGSAIIFDALNMMWQIGGTVSIYKMAKIMPGKF